MYQRVGAVFSQQVKYVAVRLSVVYHKRHIQIKTEPDLLLKHAQLERLRSVPVIVQPRFADRDHLWMFGQRGELFEIIVGYVVQVLGMKADCGVAVRIPLGKLYNAACGFQIDRVVDDAAHAHFGQGCEQLVAILVEPRVVIVRVRIKNIMITHRLTLLSGDLPACRQVGRDLDQLELVAVTCRKDHAAALHAAELYGVEV